jgi:hypothetical protein
LVAEHFGDYPVDVVKMDIEGAEYEVLASPHHNRLRQCRYLIVEVHQHEGCTPKTVFAELSRLGFEETGRYALAPVHLFQNQEVAPLKVNEL